MTVTEKVAYIQGMFDGMGLDKAESKEAKILSEVLDVLKEMGEELENMDATLDSFGEEINAVSDGLADVESVLFGEDEDDDDEDEDEDECCCHDCGGEFLEAECPNCGQELEIDQSILDAGTIGCPNCGQKFALSIEDGEPED